MKQENSEASILRSRAVRLAIAALAVATLIGCAGEGPAEGEAAAEASGSTAGTDVPPPPPAPSYETVTVPEGTVLAIAFEDALSSDTSQAGDAFTATVTAPVTVDGAVAIPQGARVTGTVLEAIPSKKIGGTARLDLEFVEVGVAGGGSVPMSAVLLAEGKRQTKKDAATIGGATAGGALLGNLIGNKRGDEAEGTQIGAVVGAAVGTAIAATNENDPVVLEPGTVVEVRLDAPVTFEREI